MKTQTDICREVATEWVWETCEYGGLSLLLMLAIARDVDDNFAYRRPQPELAERVGVGVRTAVRFLKQAVDDGYLTCDPGPAAAPNTYRLKVSG